MLILHIPYILTLAKKLKCPVALTYRAKGFIDEAEELWDVFDINRQPTGKTHKRGEPFSEGEFHQVIHICIFNSKGNLLIQKRQPWKKEWSGMWDLSVAGSAIAGEDPRKAAEREALEELG